VVQHPGHRTDDEGRKGHPDAKRGGDPLSESDPVHASSLEIGPVLALRAVNIRRLPPESRHWTVGKGP
jgi:hypothetical protein